MRHRKQFAAWLLAGALAAAGAGLGAPSAYAQEKKKDEKKTRSEPGTRTADTREVLSRILRNFTDGFEALSPSTLKEWIDSEKFYDYPRFEEGVTVLLRSVGEMRVFTREVSVQVEGDRAVMIVDAEMTLASRKNPSQTEKRRQQITFDFQRTKDGWVITEINPRSFFLP